MTEQNDDGSTSLLGSQEIDDQISLREFEPKYDLKCWLYGGELLFLIGIMGLSDINIYRRQIVNIFLILQNLYHDLSRIMWYINRDYSGTAVFNWFSLASSIEGHIRNSCPLAGDQDNQPFCYYLQVSSKKVYKQKL